MTTTTQSTIVQTMYERKSVRKYDDTHILTQEEIQNILQHAVTAPSSSNLQPWRFIVFTDQEHKKELRAMAFNQEQVETASAVIAVIGNREMYKQVTRIQQQSVDEGHLSEEQRDMMIANTTKTYEKLPIDVLTQIATFDTGLISMQIMLLAKDKGLDTVPMGGFNKTEFHKRYALGEHEFPAVLLSLGKKAGEAYGSSRIPAAELTTFL